MVSQVHMWRASRLLLWSTCLWKPFLGVQLSLVFTSPPSTSVKHVPTKFELLTGSNHHENSDLLIALLLRPTSYKYFNKSLITSALFFKDIPQLRFAGRHSSPHSRLVGSLDVETRQRSRQLQYPLLNCAGWLTRHRAPGRVVPSFVARRGPRRWRGRLAGTFRKLIYMSYTLNQLSYLRRRI